MRGTPRIAFVTDMLGTLAGSEASLVAHAEMAARAGWETLVAVYPRDDGVLPIWHERLAIANVRVVVSEGDEAAAITQLAGAIEAFNADIVHFLPMGQLAAAWMRNGHNDDAVRIATETSEASERCFWYDRSTFASLGKLDAIIAPCAAVEAGLRNWFRYAGQVEIVPHVVPATPLTLRFHEFGDLKPPFRMAAISRLRIEKGIEFMIASIALLARTHDVTLDLFGEEEETQRCRKLCAAFSVTDRVRFCGTFKGNAEEDAIITNAHLLLLSSLFEGLPLAVLKSIARGRLTIATRVGGVAELLEPVDPELVVSAGDSAAMARAASVLFDSPTRLIALERRAHAHFMAQYDPAAIERRHIAFYRELAARHARCG